MKLTNKLLVLVISMILLTLLGSYIFQSKLVGAYLEKSQLDWVHTLSDGLSESVAKDTINGDKIHVQELLQRIVKDDAIEYAYVTDMNGKLFTHSFTDGFPRFLAERMGEHSENITESHTDIKYNTNKGMVTEFDAPLVKGLSARIHIGVNQLEILNIINRVTKDLIWLIVLLGIVSISLTAYIGRKVSLPLTDFTNKLLSLSYNSKQPFPKVNTSDPDIKKLVHAFEKVIKERKQAELRLDKTQERLLLHRELSPIGIIEWDTDFKFVDWNPAAEEIFGFTKEEVIGHHISENILPEGEREHVDKIWDTLISSASGNHSINENITKNGKTIYCASGITLPWLISQVKSLVLLLMCMI